MLSGGESILVGLSGGPDSVCLLSILHNLRDSFRLNLSAIYIDHGIRQEETPAEIGVCKKLCEGLNVSFVTRFIDVKTHAKAERINLQEAARHLRYRIFEETAYELKADKIALGHTADDQAETLLMRLFRGSGPTGLSAIPPVRGRIIRPLIEIGRKEVEGFLEGEKIASVLDSSNLRQDYRRNRIRLTLLPLLREINPDIIETLARTSAILREEERYFELIVTKTIMKLFSRKTERRVELFLAPLEIMDKVILRKVLRRAIDETTGLRGISFIHIEDMIELIKNGASGDRIYLPKGIRVIKDYATLILTSEPPVRLGNYELTVPGETILGEAGILIKSSSIEANELEDDTSGIWKFYASFDEDKLVFPLSARPRGDGDYFYPAGFGKRKKLQDFFVDEKIPRDERNRIPLIVSGNDIIWVVGYRGDDRFRVTGETKRVLKLELKKLRD